MSKQRQPKQRRFEGQFLFSGTRGTPVAPTHRKAADALPPLTAAERVHEHVEERRFMKDWRYRGGKQ